MQMQSLPQHIAPDFLNTQKTWPILTSLKIVQGQQRLNVHFEMALTGRKKVAMSKLMIASNSQRRHIFRHMVSFYVTIKPWPQ